MWKVSHVGVLFAVMAIGGLWASSAGAANWHTNGPKAFASTSAGASRMVIHPAGGGSPLVLQCPSSSISGTLNGPTSAALPWVNAATVTPVFGAGPNCTINSVPGFSVACSPAEWRADSYAGGDTFATAGGGVTTGRITGIDCRFSAGASTCSTATGSIAAHYVNPSPISTGVGTLTVTAAGQSVTVSKIGPGCAAVPHGAGTLGSVVGTGVGDMTFVLDGPNAPYIYLGT